MTPTAMIKLNLDIIDAFVISYDNDQVEKLWYGICEKGWFKENSGFLRSPTDVQIEMFETYTLFVEQLPIQNKLDYIHFFENQLGKTWKQLYMDSNPVATHFGFTMIEEMGSTRWYEMAIQELGMK